ncbi:class I SAM-dependent methyltransferase [Candidatus Electronema sp. PJ]|uniref:class I SAM-dependent methyltransferase n=1 Tax=Candidatus Electronema sp. PJ TaxID=3401572 RepID=UPI003AA92974
MSLSNLAVTCADPALLAQAEELALRLQLPLAQPGEQHQLLLRCSSRGLELLKLDDPNMTGSVRVDFTSGAAVFRRQQTGKELLLKAVGCKGRAKPAVIDATGGLGRDSFLLATAGCQVHLFEQEPVIAALLADGLARARLYPETMNIAARIQLTVGDAVTFLRALQVRNEQVEVIYLDPMFPERRKSALVKKELQLLQLLATADPSADQLLLSAALSVGNRVVIKRPVRAPYLADLRPSHSILGTNIRFDVHLRTRVNLTAANDTSG